MSYRWFRMALGAVSACVMLVGISTGEAPGASAGSPCAGNLIDTHSAFGETIRLYYSTGHGGTNCATATAHPLATITIERCAQTSPGTGCTVTQTSRDEGSTRLVLNLFDTADHCIRVAYSVPDRDGKRWGPYHCG